MASSVENGSGGDPSIMTVADLAGYLKVAEKSVLRMAQRGEIPGAKVASQWRFMRTVVDDWLLARMGRAPRQALVEMIEHTRPAADLAELLRDEHMVLEMRPGPKETVLRQLVESLAATGAVADVNAYVAELLEREKIVSTAVGEGVALPHVRRANAGMTQRDALVVGRCSAGTDFGAIDGGLTEVFFLICLSNEEAHLRVMAQLALCLRHRQLMTRLKGGDTPAKVRDILVGSDRSGRMAAVGAAASGVSMERDGHA